MMRVGEAARLAALVTCVAAGVGCAAVRPVPLHPTLPAPGGYVSDFHPPPEPADSAVDPQGGATEPQGGAGETDDPDAPSPPDPRKKGGVTDNGATWWTAFADPALDSVIREALRNNYFMRDVRTLIYENGLDPAMPRGALWPLQIGLPATVQHTTASAPPALGQPGYGLTFDEADVGLSASYQIDVWGQLDVTRRYYQDLVEEQRALTETHAQTLAEQVAQIWFEILEQRALRGLLERQVRYNEELLQIVKARFEQHQVQHLAVLQQEQLLLTTRAQVPLVVAQLALLNSRLSSALGRPPNPDAHVVPDDRRLPDLPPAPAVGTPADLIQASPELQVAQARVAQAEHQKSQNLASWLPTIEAFGNLGEQTFDFSQTFLNAGMGVRLTWPIFDGAQRVTRARQLELTVQRRNWQYKLAFNDAIQRVQEALVQEKKQGECLRTLREQVVLGRHVLTEARQLFEQGLSDYLPVLTALTSLSNLERAEIQAQRLLLSYRIQLYHALGGTWSRAATQLPE